MGLRLKMLLISFSTTVESFVASGQIARFLHKLTALKSISYLLTVGMTVPISQGSHIGFTSGFLEWIVKILQVIILQEYA